MAEAFVADSAPSRPDFDEDAVPRWIEQQILDFVAGCGGGATLVDAFYRDTLDELLPPRRGDLLYGRRVA